MKMTSDKRMASGTQADTKSMFGLHSCPIRTDIGYVCFDNRSYYLFTFSAGQWRSVRYEASTKGFGW